MNHLSLEKILRSWGLPEEQISIIIAAWKEGKDISAPSYMLVHSVFTTTSQDLLNLSFQTAICKNSGLLAKIGTGMHLFTVTSEQMQRFSTRAMPSNLSTCLSPIKYIPQQTDARPYCSQPHPLSIDDISFLLDAHGKAFSLSISNCNLISLCFEFAILGDIYPDVEQIDISFNPRLTTRGISQFLSIHAFKALKRLRMLGVDHDFRSNNDALTEVRRWDGCSQVEEVIVFDYTLGERYITLTFDDFKETTRYYAQQNVNLDIEPFCTQTIVFLTPDISAFELLCLDVPPFLPHLSEIYIDLPDDYDFDRLFLIKDQIRKINGVSIFNHIVSKKTLETPDSPIKAIVMKLVINKFYETCRPVPINYQGDCYTKEGAYIFDQSADYFVCSVFPTDATDIRSRFCNAKTLMETEYTSSAIISLSPNLDIAFILGAAGTLGATSRYPITLLHTKDIDRHDNDFVVAMKSGFPIIAHSTKPSTTLRSAIHADAKSTSWSIFSSLRLASLSSILADLLYFPYVFESTCTGIAMCAYSINNVRMKFASTTVIGYCPDINHLIYEPPAILCHLLMRSVKNVALLFLPNNLYPDTKICLYRCIVEVHIDDEIVTGFHVNELSEGSLLYLDKNVIFSDQVSTRTNNADTGFNFMAIVKQSLELIDWRGFVNKKAILSFNSFILPTFDESGNRTFYCVFSELL